MFQIDPLTLRAEQAHEEELCREAAQMRRLAALTAARAADGHMGRHRPRQILASLVKRFHRHRH